MDSAAIESLEERVNSLIEHLGNYHTLLEANDSVTHNYLKLHRELDNIMANHLNSQFYDKCKSH